MLTAVAGIIAMATLTAAVLETVLETVAAVPFSYSRWAGTIARLPTICATILVRVPQEAQTEWSSVWVADRRQTWLNNSAASEVEKPTVSELEKLMALEHEKPSAPARALEANGNIGREVNSTRIREANRIRAREANGTDSEEPIAPKVHR